MIIPAITGAPSKDAWLNWILAPTGNHSQVPRRPSPNPIGAMALASGGLLMNGRENTYRMQHWQLAERQRYLADLELLVGRLRADIEALTREIDEAGNAEASGDRHAAHPLFVGPLLERRDKLARTLSEIEGQIAEAREAVATAQQEVKLFEGSVAYRGFTFEDRRVRRSRRPV